MKKRILGLLAAISLSAVLPYAAVQADTTGNDPTYRVHMARDGTDYTAHITLENITATYGTFGLRYDTTLFDTGPENVTLADGLTLKYTPEELTGTDWSDENGYYVFVWQAGGYDGDEFDTEVGAKDVADIKFTLKPTANADDITLESITVMPWQKTKEAIDFAKLLPQNDADFTPANYFASHWRYTDEQNEPGQLTLGRLEKSKAVINGIDKRGFYQAAVNGDTDDETAAYFYDVKTIMDYSNIDIKKSALLFHVIDKETGEDIEGAQIALYRDADLEGNKQTDYTGEAYFPTDITKSETFSYSVRKSGYYPVPPGGAQMPQVTTTAGESTLVTVELERGYRIRGIVDLSQGSGDSMSGAVQTGAYVTFTRTDGQGVPVADYPAMTVETTADRTDAVFEADALPRGIWTVTVTKPGYVKYVITKFTFNPEDETAVTDFGEGKKITPYIGSARTGTSVSLLDAAIVKAAQRTGADEATRSAADVDDDGDVDVTDMAYVMFNYGKRTVREDYNTFLLSAYPEKP